ncbi:hypothetical protein CEXT_437321 [Caerostris extrusa]|uniref:Uncharacterized protein n=1 Tax=Caerostris extrusa TaxID=172846 RepID=A0AAV4SBR8_CAEEX|nr:hypothetical protein CEXT_437321 [Caerostris extrusa]
MSQSNSSNQQTDCEETAAAEIYSWYDISNHEQYNPAISNFHFQNKPSEEDEHKSVNLQQSSEPTEQGFSPGSQQAFDQRNYLMSRMDRHLLCSSQIEYCEGSYSTRNPIHPINIIEQTETFSLATLTSDDPLENLSFSTNNLCGNSEENILNTSETENPINITDTISIPGTSHFSVENQESCVINFDAMKCKSIENNQKKIIGVRMEQPIMFPCASNTNESKQHDFGME